MASKTATKSKHAKRPEKAKTKAPAKPAQRPAPKVVSKVVTRPAVKVVPIKAVPAKTVKPGSKPAEVKIATLKTPAGKTSAKGPGKPLSTVEAIRDAAVRKMIKGAKKRGYVTYEQLNGVLPSEEVTSEQIEDILAMLNDMGINV